VSFAHQLNVFAYVKDDTVIVEAKFSTGKIPVSGEVRVHDAENELLVTLRLQKDGSVWFPLDLEVAQGGLLIEVETGEGHDNYWILTPDDIARGMFSQFHRAAIRRFGGRALRIFRPCRARI